MYKTIGTLQPSVLQITSTIVLVIKFHLLIVHTARSDVNLVLVVMLIMDIINFNRLISFGNFVEIDENLNVNTLFIYSDCMNNYLLVIVGFLRIYLKGKRNIYV